MNQSLSSYYYDFQRYRVVENEREKEMKENTMRELKNLEVLHADTFAVRPFQLVLHCIYGVLYYLFINTI